MNLRRDSLLVLGLATSVCLLGGLVIGIATGNFATGGVPAATPTVAAPAPTPPVDFQPISAGQQASLLVVGVSDLASGQPVFEGCWVITFRPGIPEYYVLSFPPDARFHSTSLNVTLPLSAIYDQDFQQQLAYRFIRDGIEERFPALKVQAALTIDRRALPDLAVQAGPLSIQGASLTGVDLLQSYDIQGAAGMPQRMAFQQAALEALFNGLAAANWTPASLSLYFEHLPGSVADAAALDDFARKAPALKDSTVIWSVYTPELETSSTP